MAKIIRKIGRVTVRQAEPGDAIYCEGWVIGPTSKLTSNTSKQQSSQPQQNGAKE